MVILFGYIVEVHVGLSCIDIINKWDSNGFLGHYSHFGVDKQNILMSAYINSEPQEQQTYVNDSAYHLFKQWVLSVYLYVATSSTT